MAKHQTRTFRKTSKSQSRRPKASAHSTAIVPVKAPNLAVTVSDAIENVLIRGDLKELTAEQRIEYTRAFCKTLGLNLLTRPVEYILFREYDGGPERLELYIRATGAAQLRKIHRISIIPGSLKREIMGDHCLVGVEVRDGWGTTDSATGSLSLYKIKNGQRIDFTGREWDNAIMKCETKAKRRATLSICGLSMLDESQLDTMHVIGGVTPSGRIYRFEADDDTPQSGTSEAAQHVLEEKLAGRMPLNPPQEPNTPPAAPAPQPTPSGKPPAKSGGKKVPESEYRKENVPPATSPAPMQFKGTITIDWTIDPAFPRITGDIANLAFPKDLVLKRKEDFWHAFAEDAKRLREVGAEQGFKIEEILPAKTSPQRHDAGEGPAKRGAGAGRDAPSGAPASPAVVSGLIEQANPESGKVPRVSVLLKVDKSKYWMNAFDTALFGPLMAGKGKQAELYVKVSEKGDKTYRNIVGLKRVGATEYDEDMKTPIIQNRDREAGGRTLFP